MSIDIRKTVQGVINQVGYIDIGTRRDADQLVDDIVFALTHPAPVDSEPTCPFCGKIQRNETTIDVRERVATFEPLNPVTPGHRLFVPVAHTERGDLLASERLASCVEAADRYGEYQHEAYNLIVNLGPEATQTIPHVHVHYVPRREGDGLTLPWTGQLGGHA